MLRCQYYKFSHPVSRMISIFTIGMSFEHPNKTGSEQLSLVTLGYELFHVSEQMFEEAVIMGACSIEAQCFRCKHISK